MRQEFAPLSSATAARFLGQFFCLDLRHGQRHDHHRQSHRDGDLRVTRTGRLIERIARYPDRDCARGCALDAGWPVGRHWQLPDGTRGAQRGGDACRHRVLVGATSGTDRSSTGASPLKKAQSKRLFF